MIGTMCTWDTCRSWDVGSVSYVWIMGCILGMEYTPTAYYLGMEFMLRHAPLGMGYACTLVQVLVGWVGMVVVVGLLLGGAAGGGLSAGLTEC